MNNSIITLGDTVVFSNCSDFDGGYTNCFWDLGDGNTVFTEDQAVITHTYDTAGQFEVRLLVGEKENNSEEIKKIIVQ